MTLIKVALKNVLRKRIRSIAIIFAATLASMLIFSATTTFYSIGRSVQNGIEKLGADIMVVPAANMEEARKVLLSAEPTTFYMDRKNLDGVRAIQGVDIATPQLFVTTTKFSCCGMPAAFLVGFDPKTDFTITPWEMHHYKPWIGHENLDPVTLGIKLNWSSNKDLKFYGKQFRLGSLLAPTGLGFMDNSIFMPMDEIRDMIVVSKTKSLQPLFITPDQISSILLKVKDNADTHNVAKEIEASLPEVKTIVTRDLIQDVRKDVKVAVWGVMAVGLLCWLMMLALMALVFAMTVNERSRELGILRAMGATKMHVFRLLITEALVLSGTGAVAGVGVSLSVLFSFKKLIIKTIGNIEFLWPSPVLIGSLAFTCILFIILSGVISALYPAIKTTLKEPYEAIHQGM